MAIINLGQVSTIFIGNSSPSNHLLIWFDTNINKHKYFNFTSSTWELLGIIPGGVLEETKIEDLIIGVNIIPHTHSTIFDIKLRTSGNRDLKISGTYFDGTNIYIKTKKAMLGVKILIYYK